MAFVRSYPEAESAASASASETMKELVTRKHSKLRMTYDRLAPCLQLATSAGTTFVNNLASSSPYPRAMTLKTRQGTRGDAQGQAPFQRALAAGVVRAIEAFADRLGERADGAQSGKHDEVLNMLLRWLEVWQERNLRSVRCRADSAHHGILDVNRRGFKETVERGTCPVLGLGVLYELHDGLCVELQ